MSQLNESGSTGDSGISSAFQRTPINPYTQAVHDRQQSMLNEGTPAPAPTPEPEPAPAPAPAPVPQPSYDFEAERQRFAAASQQYQQQLAAQQQQMDAMASQLQEYEDLKRRAAIQQQVDSVSYDDLASIDPDDARKLGASFLSAANAPIEDIRKELAEQRQMLQQTAEQQRAEAQRLRIQQINGEILRAHPDFFELQNTPEYRQFMSQRDGLSSETRDQRAAREFLAGNTAYVVDVLNQLKGQKPSVKDIQSVAPVQTARATAAPTQQQGSQFTLGELNSLYQMRRIDYPQYMAELKKLRAAN